MMHKRRFLFTALSIAGALLLLLGGFVLSSEALKAVSGLCIGLGSAILVLGIGELLRSFIVSAIEDEDVKRIIAIEMNDERNIRIREKAGYMVNRIMNYIICVLVLVLGFMNIDKMVLIIVASLILAEFVLVIVFSKYYAKIM